MQNGVTTAIASKNEARGFYGTIEQHAEPNQAWALAVAGITKGTGRCDQAVRDFLDGRYGRHFADEVAMGLRSGRDFPRAIDEAIERWMDRRIDAAIESELGIRRGCPTSPASCACTRHCSKEPPRRAPIPSLRDERGSGSQARLPRSRRLSQPRWLQADRGVEAVTA
jgi:hypothetical protein